MYFLLKMGIFHCYVFFPGLKFEKTNLVVNIPSFIDIPLEIGGHESPADLYFRLLPLSQIQGWEDGEVYVTHIYIYIRTKYVYVYYVYLSIIYIYTFVPFLAAFHFRKIQAQHPHPGEKIWELLCLLSQWGTRRLWRRPCRFPMLPSHGGPY